MNKIKKNALNEVLSMSNCLFLEGLCTNIGAVLLPRNVFRITFYEFHYLGYVLDIENRPIEKANVTDELSSSVTKSFKNGSYKLSVGEG